VTGEGTAFRFLSLPALSVTTGGTSKNEFLLTEPGRESAEAIDALKAYRKPSGKTSKVKAAPTMPAELAAALAKVPKGFKVVAGPDGYRLSKARGARKK
jgi:hypothetical protein